MTSTTKVFAPSPVHMGVVRISRFSGNGLLEGGRLGGGQMGRGELGGHLGMGGGVEGKTEIRTGSWNVGSLTGRAGEIVDALHRRKVDFCCVQ